MKTDRELLADALDMILKQSRIYMEDHRLVQEIRARLAETEDIRGEDWVNGFFEDLKKREQRQPVRLTDEEILAIVEKYGMSETRLLPTYHLHDGSPTGEVYRQVDWDFGQDDLIGFARELLSAQNPPAPPSP